MFSSHVLSEIEETCDRVVFLRKGHLAHELTISDLFQRHRITAKSTSTSVQVPDSIADRVRVSVVGTGSGQWISIDTDGDLAPMLSWVDSLSLSQVRIEPLGLRAVYDSVHTGELSNTVEPSDTVVPSDAGSAVAGEQPSRALKPSKSKKNGMVN